MLYLTQTFIVAYLCFVSPHLFQPLAYAVMLQN